MKQAPMLICVASALLSTPACDPTATGQLEEAALCEISSASSGILHTAGNRILDEQDRLVTLRGINAGGRSKFHPYSPFEFADDNYAERLATYLDRPRSWGFDVLRVPFSWAAAEPVEGQWDEEYLRRYDQFLDAAWERGIWTVVDFHQDVYAEPYCGDGFPSWTLEDPPEPRRDCELWSQMYSSTEVQKAFDDFWSDATGVRSAFGDMWERVASRHKDRPGVIGYEIINEPSKGSARMSDWERDVLTPFYSELIARVQTADPDSLVFFDSAGVSAVSVTTDLERPVGDNIVFAPHYYQPGALFDGGLRQDVADWLAKWMDVGNRWDVPVLLGESGIDAGHPDAAIHIRRHYDAFDELGMHSTWWEYSESPELWNFEDLSVLSPDGVENDHMLDEMARPYARALAGSPTRIVVDADSGNFELEYQATANGVSEIVLPDRGYQNVRILSSGACVSRQGDKLLVLADATATSVELRIEPRAP